VAEIIWRQFHVRYHRDHVRRLMHDLGWFWQGRESQTGGNGPSWKVSDWLAAYVSAHGRVR
jgi:transposase